MKNTKGQTMALTIVAVIFFFIVGILITNFLIGDLDVSKAALHCESPADITDGTKLLCMFLNFSIIYWIILIFSVAIGSITARMLL
jgi:hypothetical protein